MEKVSDLNIFKLNILYFERVKNIDIVCMSPDFNVVLLRAPLHIPCIAQVAYLMPILVAISCYGVANGTVFACGRLSLAAGREGHLPEFLGEQYTFTLG